MTSFIRALLATSLFSFSGIAAQYYVSPVGNDNNAGTEAAPFKTIAKARDVVRTVNTNMTTDINVYLRSGWHTLTSTLTFTQADGGTNNRNVVYQAYPGEAVVISGGRQISGWTIDNATKNIWKASATGLNFRELYVNCNRATRSHSGTGIPNVATTSTGYTTSDNTMQNWGNKSDIEMVYCGQPATCAWTEKRILVQNISGTSITMDPTLWTKLKSLTQSYYQIYTPNDVENAYELLDQPGEWYLNHTTGIVYYIPRTGENMSSAVVIAPVLETLVSGAGTLANPLTNLQFKNITFAHATWLFPSTNRGLPELQAGYGMSQVQNYRTPGNVVFQMSRNLRFERCVFKHLGAAGLDLNTGCKNNSVVGCMFTDIGSHGVELGHITSPGSTTIQAQDDSNQVLNCSIHEIGLGYRGGCGIMAAYTSNTTLSHNEIGYMVYCGISIGYGWGNGYYAKNNVLSYNNIYECNSRLTDGGTIYSLSTSPNSSWHHNYVHDASGHMLYLDQGTTGINVNNNVSLAKFDWLNNNNMSGDIRDITITNNYSNISNADFGGTNVVVSNNSVITDGNWPAAARTIMSEAGFETAYKDVKNMRCACSISGIASTVKPTIISATAINSTQVKVVFSGVLDLASATATSNYQINNNIAVTGAHFVTNELNAVLLTVSNMTATTAYTLTINNVKDRNVPANTINANSTVTFGGLSYGLVGWWKLDETSGTTATDASGHGNNGVVTGGTWSYGKFNQALKFNGATDKIVIPSTALGACTGDYAISCWFYNTNNDNTGHDRWQTVFRSASGKCHLQIWGGNNDMGMAGTSGNYTMNAFCSGWSPFRWFHVILIKKGDQVYEYQNGRLAVQRTCSAISQNAEELTIGYGSAATAFGGSIDEIRLYNRALNEQDIAMLFAGTETVSVPTALRHTVSLSSVKKIPDIIKVFSINGTLVYERNLITTAQPDHIVTIGKGIYIIKEQFGTECVVRKMVVQSSIKPVLSRIINK